MIIEGMEFSGFPRRDLAHLQRLGYAGRVVWFRFRFELVFLTPFRRLVALDSADCYIWLCVMDLAGSAIQALARLCIGEGPGHRQVASFLDEYLPEFRRVALNLDDPRPDRNGDAAISPAQHFYKFFRSGLAHTFCIDWGGLQHREELPGLGASYLFATTQGFAGEHGLGIVPREFVGAFEQGCLSALNALQNAQDGEPLRLSFERTFNRVFMHKAGPPVP
jgi:hypothetical protein